MVEVASTGLRSPEVARRLGVDGADVYRLLFAGQLDGGPGPDGLVYISDASVDAYLERHGYGNLSNEPRRTGPDDAGPAGGEKSSDLDEHGPTRTRQHRPHPHSEGS